MAVYTDPKEIRLAEATPRPNSSKSTQAHVTGQAAMDLYGRSDVIIHSGVSAFIVINREKAFARYHITNSGIAKDTATGEELARPRVGWDATREEWIRFVKSNWTAAELRMSEAEYQKFGS